MDAIIIILQAGVASGTVLLFATIGELLTERSGVLNLGVEGMMLIGAMSAFSVAVKTGSPWLGLLAAMLAGGLLSQIHAFITIQLQADQVVSGLAFNFPRDRDQSCARGGVEQSGNDSAAPKIFNTAAGSNPNPGSDFFQRSQHPRLFWLSSGTNHLVLHQPHASRAAPESNRRVPGSCRCTWDQCLSIEVFLRVSGRVVGWIGRSNDQPGSGAWLVQRADNRRPGMDRCRSCDFFTMGSDTSGIRCLYFRSPAAFDIGYPGSDAAFRAAQPILLQSILGFFPSNAALCLYDYCFNHWIS